MCRDITRRVKLTEATKNALTLYYTYEVKGGARADLIADAYYKDPTLDWLIWLTNNVVDPYYQWNLSENDFNDYIIKKYGSAENSIKKIAYYRNNWYDDDKVLTPSFYTNTLDESWRKYYGPFYDQNVKILYWKRKEEDWLMETNQIWKFDVTNSTSFVVGELVDGKDNSQIRRGGGEVTDVSNTSIWLKNIDGEGGGINLSTTIVGEVSETTGVVASGASVYIAISLSEQVFWSPVTYFDIENEHNAYARSINILDSNYLMPAMNQLKSILKA